MAEGVFVVEGRGVVGEIFQNAYKSKKIQGLIRRTAILGKQRNGLDVEDNSQIAWEQVWKICEKFEGSQDEDRLLAYLSVAVPRKLGRVKKIPSEELLIGFDFDSVLPSSTANTGLHEYSLDINRFISTVDDLGLSPHMEVLTGNYANFQKSTSDESCADLLGLGRSTFQRKRSILKSKLKEALGC